MKNGATRIYEKFAWLIFMQKNLLDFIPKHNSLITFTTDKKGIVTLEVKNSNALAVDSNYYVPSLQFITKKKDV